MQHKIARVAIVEACTPSCLALFALLTPQVGCQVVACRHAFSLPDLDVLVSARPDVTVVSSDMLSDRHLDVRELIAIAPVLELAELPPPPHNAPSVWNVVSKHADQPIFMWALVASIAGLPFSERTMPAVDGGPSCFRFAPGLHHHATPDLTPRECDIASAICCAFSNKQIAWELRISESTVKNHIRAIMAKLNLVCRMQIADYYRARPAS